MSDRPADDAAQKSPIRALFDWFKGSPPAAPAPRVSSTVERTLPSRLGHYILERRIGQGGMGTVYAARDEKLQRRVAVKTMSGVAQDEAARQRFWREARVAASVNHPNVCQIHEIGEEHGELFIAMELLEGSPLSDRLSQGPMSVSETTSVALQILAALSALHQRGVIHRDLKPSNVIVLNGARGPTPAPLPDGRPTPAPSTPDPDGRVAPTRSAPDLVKLLDFGLARPSILTDPETSPALTREGALIGTPHYMSPEQALGQPVDVRSDLFAAGAILFEMLAGRPAFPGATLLAILHATVYEEPPALSGSPAVAAIDRVIRRALAKQPADRPISADEMADELRSVRATDSEAAAAAQPLLRLVVLPFRNLRPDPDTDFLAFSLPDAIASSLSSVGSLVVRSSAVAARYGGEAPDLKTLAAEAGVDRVVMGTLLRAGEELRVVTQLVEAPTGTMIASHTVQMPLGDLFKLQDDITHRVADALALPLGGGLGSAGDRPHNPRAYELYLRGNELGQSYDTLAGARDLYERAVALDPMFAPAWARLGRCHRVIGKYLEVVPGSAQRAEEAYRRALDLNPRLAIAHKLYAALEADIGHAERAIVRLLGEASRHGTDAELFAGLVHACRYCGLYDESLAAHAEARRLDPTIRTSYLGTLLLMGETDRLVAAAEAAVDLVADNALQVTALGMGGRIDEARAALAHMSGQTRIKGFQRRTAQLAAWLDRRVDDMLAIVDEVTGLGVVDDPEALYERGWQLCDVGEHARGLSYLERVVARGYYPAPALASRPQFDALRDTPGFHAVLAQAEAGRARALAAFREAGGDSLLGR